MSLPDHELDEPRGDLWCDRHEVWYGLCCPACLADEADRVYDERKLYDSD